MKTSFEVENVKCNGCVQSIKDGLGQLSGVSEISVDLDSKMLSFESSEEQIAAVEAKLIEIGYPKKENDILQKAKAYLNNQK